MGSQNKVNKKFEVSSSASKYHLGGLLRWLKIYFDNCKIIKQPWDMKEKILIATGKIDMLQILTR